jgi:hypothetical protein
MECIIFAEAWWPIYLVTFHVSYWLKDLSLSIFFLHEQPMITFGDILGMVIS